MYLRHANLHRTQGGDDRLHHQRRAADEYLTISRIGNEPHEHHPIDPTMFMPIGHVVGLRQDEMAVRGQSAQFRGEHEILGGLDRVEQHNVPVRADERFDKRPNRRDANAARHHEVLIAG